MKFSINKKILIINIVTCFIIFCGFEFLLFQHSKQEFSNNKYVLGKYRYESVLSPDKLRPPSGLEFKKRPIIILGCSFAYGYKLKDNQTISYKLAELAKRPVYNYAVIGKGFQNSLFILEKNIMDKSIKDPEYIIYVFMADHLRRMYNSVCPGDFVGQPEYKLNKNGRMVLISDYFPIYKQLYTTYYLNNISYRLFRKLIHKKNNKLMEAYFRTMNDEIMKKYPNSKFVILVYGSKKSVYYDFSELEKEGFIVMGTNEITGKNLFERDYQISKYDKHPVEKAWNIIVPALKKELNL